MIEGWWRICHTTKSNGMARIDSAKDLIVYKKSYALAMRIFGVTKSFPREERYALVSQLRRSSRSPCRSLREAWAKRRYEAHFVSKLTDADAENGETDTSLDFARDCGYITKTEHAELTAQSAEIGRILGAMIRTPQKFLISDP
jgi:four helix bundle protein